jgi:hypothetical protein
MKKLLLIPLILLTLTVGWALGPAQADASNDGKEIVGAWEVTADAPYAPHLFTFHADGTVLTTNPTNVQDSPTAPRGGTHDSVGMGQWEVQNEEGQKVIVGTFEQLNAFADNDEPAPTLEVSFKVRLANDGSTFEGPAVVRLGGEVVDDSSLEGTKRIVVNQADVDSLEFPEE